MIRFLPLLILAGLIPVHAADATPTTRQILICSSSQASPALQQLVAQFKDQAAQVPVLAALIAGNDAAPTIGTAVSEDLMQPKSYDFTSHNHLVVIGLRSQDPLLEKVWGMDATVDEAKKSFYAEGWGYLGGDIGWVESDWNPFLHSRRVKNAPEDTITVKITGTSEAGIEAALRAFRGGMINGFVVAGPLTRSNTTLLDLDPLADPAPATLPAQIKIGDANAALAGWTQVPEQEYRAVLEAGGAEPVKMWRYKYIVPGLLEQKPIVRWLGGVNRMAYGNAIDIIQCKSADEATAVAQKMGALNGKDANFQPVTLASGSPAWQAPQLKDETTDSTWNIIVTSTGPYVLMSSLPPEGTSAVMDALASAKSH